MVRCVCLWRCVWGGECGCVWVLGGGCECGKVGLGMERWCVWEDVYH